jgi:hypothetical protein
MIASSSFGVSVGETVSVDCNVVGWIEVLRLILPMYEHMLIMMKSAMRHGSHSLVTVTLRDDPLIIAVYTTTIGVLPSDAFRVTVSGGGVLVRAVIVFVDGLLVGVVVTVSSFVVLASTDGRISS